MYLKITSMEGYIHYKFILGEKDMNKRIITTLLVGCMIAGSFSFAAENTPIPVATGATVEVQNDEVNKIALESENEVKTEDESVVTEDVENENPVDQAVDSVVATEGEVTVTPAETVAEEATTVSGAVTETIPEVVVEEPQIVYNEDGYELIEKFDNARPEGLVEDLQYTGYQNMKDYIVVLRTAVNVRKLPTTSAPVIAQRKLYQRADLLEIVRGQYFTKSNSDLWYKVTWQEKGKTVVGYVYSKIVVKREYKFQKMYDQVNYLKDIVDNNSTAYINNYKNWSGRPPKWYGKEEDGYGVLRDQSAPGYFDLNDKANFRYLMDGYLVSILGEVDGMYKVASPNIEGVVFVPKKYVQIKNSINNLEKVIVVDRKEQNEGVFQFIDGKWHMVSFNLSTTGAPKSKHKMPTDLGYFMAMEKKPKFLYLDDETKKIDGYAPYAIRFNGGAYTHGVPVVYIKITEEEIVQPEILDEEGNVIQEKIVNEKIIGFEDPGKREYLSTIGTTPRSHKCVRNYTSHAKFMYEWIEIGKSAIIVIE